MEISSSTLTHIHEAKGAVGFLLSKFGIDQLQTVDAGGAYLGLFPGWWLLVGGLLLISSIIFAFISILNFSALYRTGDKLKNTLFIFGYAVLSFSLVKTAIDGGIFSPVLLAIGLGIFIFSFMQKQKNNQVILLGVFAISIIGLLAVLLTPQWTVRLLPIQCIATLTLLTSILIYVFGTPKRIYLGISVVLFLIAWWMASFRDQSIFRYGKTTIDKGQSYLFYDSTSHTAKRIMSEQDFTIRDITRLQNKNLSYAPVSVPGKTCSENSLPQFINVLVKTKSPLNTIQTPHLNIVIKAQTHNGSWWDNNVLMMAPSCTPEVLTVIDDTLKTNGFDFYVMVDPVFYDESVAR